jgi:NNP family nitrate/nitrite transporter-like MFS transporter
MKIRGTPSQGLFGATLGFFIGFAAVALFGPTAAAIKQTLGLTPLQVGFLVAMPSLSGSLLRIPFAAWVDTAGGRKPFLVLLSIAIIGMIGLAVLISLYYPDRLTPAMTPLLFVLGALVGCGIATFSVGIAQVSYWFPKAHQGTALGTFAGIGNLAPGIFSFLLPLALVTFGMSGSYLLWLGLLVLGTLGYAIAGRNAPYFQAKAQGSSPEQAVEIGRQHRQEIFPQGKLRDSLVKSAQIWKTWMLVAIYFITFGGFIALTSWLPTYWREFFGQPAITAGTLTATYSITASVLRVFGGGLADKLGGEKTTILALAVMLTGAVLMTFSQNFALSIFAVVLMAVGMGVGNASVFKLVPQYVPQAVGGAAGWVGGLGAFGGFTIPPILGAIVSVQGSAGYSAGFGLFVGCGVIAMALAFVLKKTYKPMPVTIPAVSKPS